MPYTDYEYNDPLHIVWRNGTVEDPYIDRAEYLKVVNQIVVLSEIPEKLHRVSISGMREVNYEKITNESLAQNEYSVNYSTGIIQFHRDREGETFNITYKGKGFIQYPSDRIYHQDKFNNVVRSLYEIIEESNATIKLTGLQIEAVEEVIQQARETINDTVDVTDQFGLALQKVEVATDLALDAYDTTRLVFKPYAQSYMDMLSTYTNPKIGWTVQVYDTGIRYRFDGISWIPIDLFGGNMHVANHTLDGLMSKEDKKKLDDFSEGSHERTIVFCIPMYPDVGVQHVYARFPYKGEIKGMRAFAGVTDTTGDNEIAIQTSTNMIDWYDTMTRNLVIKKDNYFDDGLRQLTSNTSIAKNTIFRVEFRQQGNELQDVTIEVILKTIYN